MQLTTVWRRLILQWNRIQEVLNYRSVQRLTFFQLERSSTPWILTTRQSINAFQWLQQVNRSVSSLIWWLVFKVVYANQSICLLQHSAIVMQLASPTSATIDEVSRKPAHNTFMGITEGPFLLTHCLPVDLCTSALCLTVTDQTSSAPQSSVS